MRVCDVHLWSQDIPFVNFVSSLIVIMMLELFSLVLTISVVQTKLVVSSFAELYREDGSLDADLIFSKARLVSEVTQRSTDYPDIEEYLRVYEYFLIDENGEEEQTLMDAQMPIDLKNNTMTMTNKDEPWIKANIELRW